MVDTGPALFNSVQPTGYLYVSASVAAGGDGSRDHPFNTIQQAVDQATAGTAIMVGAGEYHENVKLPSVSPSTAAAPIWLISAEGQGAAKVIAPSNTVAAIYGYGTDNFVVKDFAIDGGKNGIQFSQSGSNFTNLVQNIVVEGNIIQNTVEDGIKIDQADNVQILGNTVDTAGQEGVDFVAVNNSLIAYNDVSHTSGAAGIMVKGGSTNVLVDANNVHDIAKNDGIEVGGWSTGDVFVPGYTGYEAKNITVVNNEVSNVPKVTVNVLGGVDSTITGNYLQANPAYYWAMDVGDGMQNGEILNPSTNIEITDNIVIAKKLSVQMSADSQNISIQDNSLTGIWTTQTGPAALSAAANIIATYGNLPPSGIGTVSVDPISALMNDYYGGTGNDVLLSTPGSDYLNGEAGVDVASYANAGAGVTVDLSLSSPQNTLGAGSDQLVNIENLVGSAFNDTLKGDGGDNVLSGGGGNDFLRGDLGNNTLDGGSGIDTAVFALAPGNYYVTANGDGSYTVQGPAETDTLTGIEQASFDATGQTLTMAQFAAQSFNPLEYIASNTDLIQYIGDNQALGLQHYLLHGYAEGRQTASFNALEYIASNPDLLVGFGDNQTLALEHYILHGYGEGRGQGSFNALQYIASNPDLIPSLGDNQTAALENYILTGYGQGRPATSFDVLEYVASNPDLAKAWGSANAANGYEHYILHGYYEGRSTNSFDAVAYLLSYPDLQNGHLTAQTAELHYVNHGVNEGRSPNGSFGSEQTQHALTLGTPLSDIIATTGDEDWFSINLAAGQSYTLTLSGADSASGTLADPRLELHDVAGVLLASDNDSGPGKDALIHITAPTSGTFYLVAASNTPTTGTYKILAATG